MPLKSIKKLPKITSRKSVPEFFINAFYESKFRDNLFVIKAGGKVIEDDRALRVLLGDIQELSLLGIKILLIYGGGRALDEACEQRGLEIQKHQGRRITNRATMDVMQDIIGGRLSIKVQQEMGRARLEGLSLNAIPPDWMRVSFRPKNPIDFGYVGDVETVSARPIMRLFKSVNFIACPCLAYTYEEMESVNINADTIATELAVGLGAHKLVFLSDVDGVDVDGKTAFIITAEEIPALIKKGTVNGGMQVKLENCEKALRSDVRRIHLISGLRKHALRSEIFEPVGPGTMLITENERENYLNEVEAQKVLERQRDAAKSQKRKVKS
jgi:acetylglutamate kinase